MAKIENGYIKRDANSSVEVQIGTTVSRGLPPPEHQSSPPSQQATAPGEVVQQETLQSTKAGTSYAVPKIVSDMAAAFVPITEKKVGGSVFTSIAITQNDDPWAADLSDHLGANDEAKAFARLAVAKDFIPPLAIGLFGDWGSGKSFFMRLIYQHIEHLSRGEPSADAPEANPDVFHTDVVQIRFNAWHYVETNLWASLVSHLFTELDRWYDKNNPASVDPLLEHLSTSRILTLEAAQNLVQRRHDQRVASEQLLQAQEELEAARAKTASSPTVYLAAVAHVFNLPNDRSDLGRAKSQFEEASRLLGLDAVTRSARSFQHASNALQNEAGRARLLARGFKYQLFGWPNVVALAAIVLSFPWLAKEGMERLTAYLPFMTHVREDLLLLSVTVTAVTTRMRWILTKVRKALTRLEDGKAGLDKAIDEQLATQKDAFQNAQQELAKVNASVDEAKALVRATSERLARAAHDYSQGTGAGRLKKFVHARATDGEYAQHLGLIATVRKDFEELAFNVAESGILRDSVETERAAFALKMNTFLKANESLLDAEDVKKLENAAKLSPTPVRSFKRITLYIDDLDRCPPEKVVEVLQAVHLLLTFPLFVVMVAVDVRWIRKALLSHYPGLISEAGELKQTASVSDYLEKIFQIPYWVRPMDSLSSEQFLRSQLNRIKGPAGKKGSSASSASKQKKERVFVRENTPKTLRITQQETEALQALVPYVGTSPRRALRFLNVYRLIKVSFNGAEAKTLACGDYKLLLTLLAMAMGTPLSFSKLHGIKDRQSLFTMEDLRSVARFRYEEEDRSELERLTSILALYITPAAKSEADISRKLNKYVNIVQRYSFDG